MGIHVCSDLGDVFRCLSQALKEVHLGGQVAVPEVIERLGVSADELFLRNVCHQLHLKLSVYRPGLDHRHTDRQRWGSMSDCSESLQHRSRTL